MTNFVQEIKNGQRFEFGKNWQRFLSSLTEERIQIAENSLKEMLMINDLEGKTFLDIGSGSGIFSLIARRLGANVYSFDYDPDSVACTKELRSRYFPNDNNWVVEEGSILDESYLKTLGNFDVVYSWGVLHHTGNLWKAIKNTVPLVNKGGKLFIALYNNQGRKSKLWKKVKKMYCSGFLGKSIISIIFIPYFFLRELIKCVINRKNVFMEYKNKRGMSLVRDWYDWLGGYPFEVSQVDEIFHFYKNNDFVLLNIHTVNGYGNNQFVFEKGFKEKIFAV